MQREPEPMWISQARPPWSAAVPTGHESLPPPKQLGALGPVCRCSHAETEGRCITEVIDISPGNLDSSLCFFQSSVSHDVLCIEVK